MTRARGKMRKRRTKAELDPAIFEIVIAVVRVGAGQEAACREAGISNETLRQYVQRGETGEEPFAEFVIALRKAHGNSKVYLLGLLQEAAVGDWRAAAWLLEKLYPHDFGALVKLNINAQIDAKLEPRFDLSKLSMSELHELKRIRQKMGMSDAADGNERWPDLSSRSSRAYSRKALACRDTSFPLRI